MYSHVQDDLAGADRSFEQHLAQLPLLSQLSDLKLELPTAGHAFAPVVLHLLKIRPVKVLRVWYHFVVER